MHRTGLRRAGSAPALDPAWLLAKAGMPADDWQRQLLACGDRRLLVCCSRQAGKSTVVAALALHTALFHPGCLVLILAPGLRQAQELHTKLRGIHAAVSADLGAWAGVSRLGAVETVFAQGSRVVALPGNEARVRGFSGPRLVVLDEAARIPDSLYASVRPLLAVSRGRLVAMSTPFGKRGWFWREWETGKEWRKFRIPWNLCPRIEPAFIDNEREALGDAWVEQEYGCSFGSSEGLVYPAFDTCLVRKMPHPLAGEAVGGIDFGWRNPFSAVWGTRDREDLLLLHGERHKTRTPLSAHAQALPRAVRWFADPAGRTEIEELKGAGLRVWPAPNAIRAGIAAVHGRLESGRLQVLADGCPNLVAEAGKYRYDTDGDGEEPLDRDNHALAALRYLIAGLDKGRVARVRKPG